jgi:RNA polymerase sigma-70 factor (ECF subfamily)
VYRVTTNAALDEIRRRERRPRLLPDPGATDEPPSLHQRPPGTGPFLDDQLADRLDLDAALGRLPVEFRAVVVLRDVMGLDYAEIAEVLDLPPGTVRSRIARGRTALARSLRRPRPVEGGNQRATPDVGRDGPS